MTKAKIIDLKTFVETTTEGKYTAFQHHDLAIIEGPKGVIVSDDEGIHTVELSTADKIQIAVQYNNETLAMMPEGMGDEFIGVLLESNHINEQPLNQYIKTFGDRIESNYQELLESIKEIGLDPEDFKRN
jgi:hypothetical protein